MPRELYVLTLKSDKTITRLPLEDLDNGLDLLAYAGLSGNFYSFRRLPEGKPLVRKEAEIERATQFAANARKSLACKVHFYD